MKSLDPGRELEFRKRLTVRVLLGIVATLAVATLLAGIRW
jgi:hypothetical protein